MLSAAHDREERRTFLQADLAVLDGISCVPFDAERMEEELRSYLSDWPSLAQQHPTQTRQILRKLLPRRIQAWREIHGNESRYYFKGDEASVGKFYSGLVRVKRFGVPTEF